MNRCAAFGLFLLAALVACQPSQVQTGPSPEVPDSPYPEEMAKGVVEAKALLAEGKFVLLVPSAVPVPWMHAIRKEEYGRYNIEYRLTGDTFNPMYEEYRAGFNGTMREALYERYGADVLERIQGEIERRLEAEAPDPR